ncbi:MAG: EAL domain-containing protein [Gammaproteobacteria bacterium]|nr:EAL domain-containing protein [Gammaproteobacteria bacterium]
MKILGNSTKSFFFSLKWSALLFLSLILIVINTYFYHYHKSGLEDGFAADRDLVLQRNSAQLEGLLNQSANYLQQIAEVIPSLYGMQTLFDNNDTQAIYALLEAEWSTLQIQTNVDTVGFYNIEGQAIKMWGDTDLLHESFAPQIETLLSDKKNLEKPISKVFCNVTCRQYVFSPIYSQKKQWGVTVVGRSLVETIINFSRTSNIDIGILSTRYIDSIESQRISRILNLWNAKVMALSDYSNTISIVQTVSETVSLNEILSEGVIQKVNGKMFEIKFRPLSDSKDVFVIFLEDITEPVSVIKKAMSETLWTGVFGVMLSELALILILWPSLSNLKRILDVIPLLAVSAFERAREDLGRSRKSIFFRDEINFLDDSVLDLALQLEGLEKNVAERTRALSNKMDELTTERDFIKHLLDTAQVVIVTQDKDGKILLVSQQVEHVIGYQPEEIMGQNFSKYLCGDSDQSLFRYNLRKVSEGSLSRYRNEISMPRKNGKMCTIEWLHSHIESVRNHGATVLSVGLDISERKAHEQEIGWLADHDSLTGLYNRRRFNSILKRTLSIANRYKQNVGLLFLDLDNFKQINDTLGHQTGDLLIKSVSDCLKLILRESDYIARLGGDEFAIILPNITVEDVIDVANKINKHLFSLRLPMMDANHRTCASIGVALYPEHAVSANDLLSNADLAMYQAKSRGRGCWHMFDKADNVKERIETQLYWRHKIVDALAHDKFELHYQPILNISDNNVSHYEALVRIREESGELVLPSPFIAVAEKTGLIHDIDHLVLRKAIGELQRQSEKGIEMVMTVNLSAHSFSDPQLLPLLDRLLGMSDVNPSNIIFEITETAALSDLVGAANLIKKIHDFGCRFALDDFGVGFSSFYYLKELPVDFVKIDGSFIQDLPANRNDQILVKAMADIAKEFGKKTIAEFVQDDETLSLLRSYNIDYAQGYFVGRPAELAA